VFAPPCRRLETLGATLQRDDENAVRTTLSNGLGLQPRITSTPMSRICSAATVTKLKRLPLLKNSTVSG
jgi:hypothetical protein